MKHKATGLPVAFVAIGALLVGSIKWTKGAEKGSEIKRGDEVGYVLLLSSSLVGIKRLTGARYLGISHMVEVPLSW